MWVPNGCPHEPGLPVVVEYVGGQASRFGGLDAGLLEHRTNHGGASALCSVSVLPVQCRETKTRRPPSSQAHGRAPSTGTSPGSSPAPGPSG